MDLMPSIVHSVCRPACVFLWSYSWKEVMNSTLLCAIEEHQCHQSTCTLLTKAGQILEAAVSAFTIDIISHW